MKKLDTETSILELLSHPQDVHHFDRRALEWWLASYTTFFGIMLALPSVSMGTAAFDIIISWADEDEWGLFFGLVGIFHLAALWINGRRWWTPFVRTVACSITMAAFTMLAFAFGVKSLATTAVFTYGAIATASLFCVYRAVKDAVHSIEIRRAEDCLPCRRR